MSEFASKASSHGESSHRDVNMSYIIGRMNPPHAGHIHLISEMIRQSKDLGARPLILLGNGPSNGNPMDDPLKFDLKRDIIIQKLSEREIEPTEYTIVEKGKSPIQNIIDFAGKISDIEHIKITYFVGHKPPKNEGDPDDTEKMDWINPYLVKHFHELSYEIGKVIIPAISTGEALMSGTIVRESVYKTHLLVLQGKISHEAGFTNWISLYPEISNFYGDTFAHDVYAGILHALQDKNPMKNIEVYLSPKPEKRKRKASVSASLDSNKTKTKKVPGRSTKSSGKGGKSKHYKSYRKSYRHNLYDKSKIFSKKKKIIEKRNGCQLFPQKNPISSGSLLKCSTSLNCITGKRTCIHNIRRRMNYMTN